MQFFQLLLKENLQTENVTQKGKRAASSDEGEGERLVRLGTNPLLPSAPATRTRTLTAQDSQEISRTDYAATKKRIENHFRR